MVRKKVSLLKTISFADDRYFLREEYKETLSATRVFDPARAVRENRPGYTYKSGTIYDGQWRGGFRDGHGKISWPDGAVYEGNWALGRAEGQGKFVYVDGDVYEGEWRNDKAKGYGTYHHANGAKYEGMWKDDL